MGFNIKLYEGNSLDITDEQVAADWRMGLLRSIAKVMRQSAYPTSGIGSYGATIPGSDREHVMGNFSSIAGCPLVEIYSAKEERGEEYIYDSFSGGYTVDIAVLSALATCKCGRIIAQEVSMNVSTGELIHLVTNA